MTKKYTMTIIYRETEEVVKTVNSNSIKYIAKIWKDFFLTSDGKRTTAILDFTICLIDNIEKLDLTADFGRLVKEEK